MGCPKKHGAKYGVACNKKDGVKDGMPTTEKDGVKHGVVFLTKTWGKRWGVNDDG